MISASLFRVTQQEYATSSEALLSGLGGLHVGGRWHVKGCRVTYFSSSRALCLLEKLTHLDLHPSDITWPFVAACLTIDEDFLGQNALEITRKDLDLIDPQWQLPESLVCRKIGITWYRDAEFLFLKVPSAVVPDEYNFVLNAEHSAVIELIGRSQLNVSSIAFDRRIAEVLDREALSRRRRQ